MTPLPTRARIEEMCEQWAHNADQAQQIKILRHALASVERDRSRLEREVETSRGALAAALEEIDGLRDIISAQREQVP